MKRIKLILSKDKNNLSCRPSKKTSFRSINQDKSILTKWRRKTNPFDIQIKRKVRNPKSLQKLNPEKSIAMKKQRKYKQIFLQEHMNNKENIFKNMKSHTRLAKKLSNFRNRGGSGNSRGIQIPKKVSTHDFSRRVPLRVLKKSKENHFINDKFDRRRFKQRFDNLNKILFKLMFQANKRLNSKKRNCLQTLKNLRKKKFKIESLDLEKIQKDSGAVSDLHSRFVSSLSGRKVEQIEKNKSIPCIEKQNLILNEKICNKEIKTKNKKIVRVFGSEKKTKLSLDLPKDTQNVINEQWIDAKVKKELHNLWSNRETLSNEFNCFRLKYKTFNALKYFWSTARASKKYQPITPKMNKRRDKLDMLSSMFIIKELSEEYENSFKNSSTKNKLEISKNYKRIKTQIQKYRNRNFNNVRKKIKSINYKQKTQKKTTLKSKIQKKLRNLPKKNPKKDLKINTKGKIEGLKDTLNKLKVLLDSKKTKKRFHRKSMFEGGSERRKSGKRRVLRFNEVRSFSDLYEKSKSFSVKTKNWKTFVKLKNIR